MRFLILGAGAIGGYVGGHLALAGHLVTFAARPRAAAQLAANGVRLRLPGEPAAREVRNIFVAGSLAEAFSAGKYDCLVLAIKSFDTAAALAELRAATAAPPPVLCLQNGVGNEAEIAAAFGPASVIAGTVTTPASLAPDGQVNVERARGLGIALEHPLAATLVDILNAAGLKTRAYPAAGRMKWSKLLTNLLGNASSALLDWPVGKILADPRGYRLEAAAQRECLAVMRALGYPVVDLPGVPVRMLAFAFDRLPAGLARPLLARAIGGGRGGKMPSLHVDVHAGRSRTEVGWLNGAVARHAADLGLPAPVNAGLAELVTVMAEGKRRGAMTVEEVCKCVGVGGGKATASWVGGVGVWGTSGWK